jgi:hypothetical protein
MLKVRYDLNSTKKMELEFLGEIRMVLVQKFLKYPETPLLVSWSGLFSKAIIFLSISQFIAETI